MHTRIRYILLLTCIALCCHVPSASRAQSARHDREPGRCYETTVDDNGSLFAVAWSRRTVHAGRIEGVVLHSRQRTDLRTRVWSDPSDSTIDERPSLCWITDTTVLLVWERIVASRHRICGRFLHADGTPASGVFTVSDSASPYFAMSPSVQRASPGIALAAWQDARNGTADVLARVIHANGDMEVDTLVNQDGARALQGVPTVSSNSHGAPFILWVDNRLDGAWSFFARCLLSPRAEPDVLIDSAQPKDMTIIGSAAWIDPNRTVFVWKDYREGDSNIFFRIRDARSGRITSAVRVNSDHDGRWQRLPWVDACSRGFVICWEDYRNSATNQLGDIFARAWTLRGTPATADIRISAGDDRRKRKQPHIALAPGGCGLVTWYQDDDNVLEVHARWIAWPLSLTGDELRLSVPLQEGASK